MNGEPANPAFRISEAQLHLVLDSTPARIALVDRSGRHCYVNQAYCDRVGRPAGEIVGRTIRDIVGAAVFDQLRPDTTHELAGRRALDGETVHWEGWLNYPQGPRYDQRIYFPCPNGEGVVDGYFAFARDLTDLKRSEEQLAERLAALDASEARNTAITASALDCIIAIDEAGLVVEFNPAAEETFGYRRVEAMGRSISELIVPPALRERHANGLLRYLQTGSANILGRRIEMEAMRSDGGLFPVELAVSEVRLQHRRLFTAYLRDLSAARAATAEIARQRDALYQSEKMAAFGSLLAGVAHELNNPLSIVIGNALMLSDDAAVANPDLAARARLIQVAAERCGRITHSFLAMARQHKPEPCPTEVDVLVDDALQLLKYGLTSSGVEIERDVPAGLPLVPCDASQINQVLTNLLVNARQALEGQPTPRRVRIEARQHDGAIEILVSDNGPGIAESIRARIFDPFFTTKPIGAGTGIGLSVSRGIVETHGGTLTLAPAKAQGIGFVIRLPLGEATPQVFEAEEMPASAPARRVRRALIVDDEREIGSILSQMLGTLAFECDVADSGISAQAQMQQHNYDIVLCDIRMPDIDGPALFDWMKKHRPLLCDRTAFVTGDTLGQAAGVFLAGCGRPVLEKPFRSSDIGRLVQELSI
jgi:PAS domain S-box-containing protein